MKIMWLGLGKLGLPSALTFARYHRVVGVDPDERARERARMGGLDVLDLVEDLAVDLVFVAVQTPHATPYGGHAPMPEAPRGFDTEPLERALIQIANLGPTCPVVVVSTVLPGTCDLRLAPMVEQPLLYNPFFVAMGSVEEDLHGPEFVLIGARPDDGDAADLLARAYEPIHCAPVLRMSRVSAELAKVAYNTAITSRLVFVNALAQLADRTGANVDDVTGALTRADQRIVSTAYWRAGMGDAGPCHPRDGIAMTAFSRSLGVMDDPFSYAVRAREAQASWLADLIAAEEHNGQVVVLGRAYKPGVPIDEGSAARLVAHYLEATGIKVVWVDPLLGLPIPDPLPVGVYVLATCHSELVQLELPAGSTLIDPWGAACAREGVRLVQPGRRSRP